MKIIDANSGALVQVGGTFNNIDGMFTLLSVDEQFLSARVLLRNERGEALWADLHVRYMHPNFLFQKVGFIQS